MTLVFTVFLGFSVAMLPLCRHGDRRGSFSRRSEPDDNKDLQPHRYYPKHRYGRASAWDEDREEEERRWQHNGQRRRPPSRGSIHSAYEYGNEYRNYGDSKRRAYRAGSRGAASDRHEDDRGGKDYNGDTYEDDDDDFSSGTGEFFNASFC